MYDVLISQRDGLKRIAGFRLLTDALRCAESARNRHAVAIRTPNGSWYRDPVTGRAILVPRER